MYALWSSRFSEYTSACTCWVTRGVIPPCVVSRIRWGLRTIVRRSATKPRGTVTVATTLPVRSSRAASSEERRTRWTSLLTRSIVRLTSKVRSPTTTRAGRWSSSTSAMRGFELAYPATRPTSPATTSGYATSTAASAGERRRMRRSFRNKRRIFTRPPQIPTFQASGADGRAGRADPA